MKDRPSKGAKINHGSRQLNTEDREEEKEEAEKMAPPSASSVSKPTADSHGSTDMVQVRDDGREVRAAGRRRYSSVDDASSSIAATCPVCDDNQQSLRSENKMIQFRRPDHFPVHHNAHVVLEQSDAVIHPEHGGRGGERDDGNGAWDRSSGMKAVPGISRPRSGWTTTPSVTTSSSPSSKLPPSRCDEIRGKIVEEIINSEMDFLRNLVDIQQVIYSDAQ